MRLHSSSLLLLACCANALTAQEVILQQVGIQEKAQTFGADKGIDTELLEKIQAKDLSDVFSKESSMSIGGGAINAQRIYLRGIEGSNLNITLDGAKQGTNLHQHRGNVMGLDPDLLKAVNIHTTANAENGYGALGGAISMTTKDAQDLIKDDETLGAIVRANYSSVSDAERGSTTLYGMLGDNTGFYVHLSGENRDDYTQGGGEIAKASAYRNRSYFAKLSMLDLADHSLRISVEQNANEGNAKYGSTGSDMGPYVGDGSDLVMQVSTRNTYTIEHIYDPKNSLVHLTTNLYHNTNSLENETANTETLSKDFGGKIKNKTLVSFGSVANIFTLGADFYKEEGISKYADGSEKSNVSKNIALFTQNTTSLFGLDIHYGARYDSYDVEFGPRTLSGEEFSPNGGLEYTLMQGFSVFGNYGESIRASGIIPVGWMNNIVATTNFNDEKPFKPESATQQEAGVKFSHADLVSSDDRLHITLSAFKTSMKDTIERVGGGGGPVSKIWNNPQKIESKGYEAKISWENERIYLGANYTKVKTTSDAEEIDVIRRKASNVGDKVVLNTDFLLTPELSLGYIFTGVKGLHNQNTTTKPRPGYALHDIQAQFRSKNIEGLEFSLALNNITDKKYAQHTSMYGGGDVVYEAGRDVRLSVKYQF